MKQIILLLLLSFIVACGDSPKDTQDPGQENNVNTEVDTEQEELYTITLKEDPDLEDLSHKVIFVTQGNKFEFDITSNDFCVVLKKSQFKTLSITLNSSHWTYLPVSDFYCDNNAPEKTGPAPAAGRYSAAETDECKIPTANLFLEVNETLLGFEHNLAKAEKRNPNIDKCKKLY